MHQHELMRSSRITTRITVMTIIMICSNEAQIHEQKGQEDDFREAGHH